MSVRAVSVAGSGTCSEEEATLAREVGRLLAERGVAVVCGGLGGVMQAVCQGAFEAGGLTVGILPGTDPAEANPYVRVAIPTNMGEARNPLMVRAGESLIASGGEYGTLSEIALGLKWGKRVVGLGTWELRRAGAVDSGVLVASTPLEAVSLALES